MKISNYLLLSVIAIVISGIKLNSRKDYRYVLDSEHNLYIEVVHSWLPGTQRAEYLTDSTSFRIYAGKVDNRHSYLVYKYLGGRVSIEKREKVNNEAESRKLKPHVVARAGCPYSLKTIYKKEYNLTDLRRQHNFE